MRPEDRDELIIGLTRRIAVRFAVVALCCGAALIGYLVVLGVTGVRLWLLAGWIAIVILPVVIVALVRSGGPPAALTPAGIRMRVHPQDRRTVVVPWAEVRFLWIDSARRYRFLCVLPNELGRYLSHVGPRRRAHLDTLWDRHGTPLRVPVSPHSLEQIRVAAQGFSGGQVRVSDGRPASFVAAGDAWAGDMLDPRGYPPPRSLDEHVAPGKASVIVVRLLLVAAVLLGLPVVVGGPEPWNQPWWPGVDVAMRVPDPCRVINGGVSSDLAVSGTGHTTIDDGRYRVCEFAVESGELVVSYRAHHAVFGRSATRAANAFQDLAVQVGRGEGVPGLGDEAWIAGNPSGTTTLMDRAAIDLVARRANVVLHIRYRGEREPDVARAAVIEAGRDGLAAVRVS